MTPQEKDKLLGLVAENKVQVAIEYMRSLNLNESAKEAAILISGQYKQLKEKNIRGTVSFEQGTLTENQIKNRIVDWASQTYGETTVKPSEAPDELTFIPTRDPDSLIGRGTFLKQLRQRLEENKSIVLMNAMGGIGKTSVAEAYTAQYYYQYKKMVWVQQIENEDFRLSFTSNAALIKTLNIQTEGKQIEELFMEICMALRQIKESPKLLVIDNVTKEVSPYWQQLPQPPNWHVLFTSRQKINGASEIELDFLEKEDALELFEFYLREPVEDHAALAALIDQFGRHTLTIELLAKAMRENNYSLTQLKKSLATNLQVGEGTEHSKKAKVELLKTYLLKIFDMSNLSKEEISLLQQFACLPGTAQPIEILNTLLTEKEADQPRLFRQCRSLYKKGWLLYNDKAKSYKMHAIIHELVPEKFEIQQTDVANLLNRITQKLKIDYAKDNPIDKFPWVPYGQSILRQLPKPTAEEAHLQNNLALVLKELGDFEGARDLLEKALKSAETNLGADHPNTAMGYSNLALVLRSLGDFESAQELLEKALKSAEITFGVDHPNTATLYSNLATVLRDLGDFEGARDLLEKALKSAEITFGVDHPNTAIHYSNLALVLQNLGDFEGARDLLEKALKSTETNFGVDHPNTATHYSNLATVLRDLGDFEGARDLLEKALKSDETNFGANHPNTTISYSNLALVLQDLGDFEGARDLLEKALKSDEANFGADHPNTTISYSNLALVLQNLGDFEGARDLLEKALKSDEANFGVGHPNIATRYSNLALVLKDLGDFEKARELLEKALKSDQANFETDHPNTAISYSNLALVLQDLGDFEKARELLEKALQIFKSVLPKGHPHIAIAEGNLKVLLEEMKG